jgi:hypothetical protein
MAPQRGGWRRAGRACSGAVESAGWRHPADCSARGCFARRVRHCAHVSADAPSSDVLCASRQPVGRSCSRHHLLLCGRCGTWRCLSLNGSCGHSPSVAANAQPLPSSPCALRASAAAASRASGHVSLLRASSAARLAPGSSRPHNPPRECSRECSCECSGDCSSSDCSIQGERARRCARRSRSHC